MMRSQMTRWKRRLLLLLNLDAAARFQNQTMHSKENERKNKIERGKYILLEYMTFTCIFNKNKNM